MNQDLSQELLIKEENSHQGNITGILDEKLKELIIGIKQDIKTSTEGVIHKVDLTSISLKEYCCMVFFNLIFFIFLLPILCGFFTIQPNEIVIVEVLGKPIKVMDTPGLNWYFPIATSFRKVSKSLRTIELSGSSVPDKNGSPLTISVVITYSIQNALFSTYNVQNETNYLHTQALEVVRRVVSKFRYRSNHKDEITLLKDSMVLGKYMKELLNIKMETAGIQVTRMELMEISYHVEIAQGMLQIQQAQAKVEARKEIVEGGVEIVKGAMDLLQEKNVELSQSNKEELIKNLMIVVCSDVGKAQPVVSL